MNEQLMKERIQKLVSERDWQRFHTPKNLVMALAGEAGELVEIFQWLTDEQAQKIMEDGAKASEVRDELADIFYYILRLSMVLKIDLEEAFNQKLDKTEKKYPVELAKGNARKYTEF